MAPTEFPHGFSPRPTSGSSVVPRSKSRRARPRHSPPPSSSKRDEDFTKKPRDFMGEIKKSPTKTIVERVLKGGWDSEI